MVRQVTVPNEEQVEMEHLDEVAVQAAEAEKSRHLSQ
jgi:hypothetical protein